MASTTTQQEMLRYFSQLNNEEQQSLLELIKTFIGSRKTFEPQSIGEYNKELDDANAEIEAGRYTTHEEVKKMFSK